jgi:ADP-ribose pyrophosphatase
MEFKRLHSKTIFQGRAFEVRQETVRLPTGREMVLDLVSHVGAVTILPLDADGHIWLVRQYRIGAGEYLLELPAGTLSPREEPEACAARELREEIGMAANSLRKIGEFYMAPGYSTEFMHVYLAEGLFSAPLERDADEFLEVISIPVQEVYAMAARNEIRDGKTLATLMLARPLLSERLY